MKIVARCLVLFLVGLSMLTWFYVPSLHAWELTVATSQLGLSFALVLLACAVPLCLKIRMFDIGFLALAAVGAGTFVAPLACAIYDHPGLVSVIKTFQPAENLVPYERLTFTAANGTTPLNLDLYLPAKTSKPSPFILVVHGGGWTNGDSQQIAVWHSHFARQGYAVMSIDYRLSPGWLWPAPLDDTNTALKFIRAHAGEWNIDPNRWAIMGRSAGAQIAGVAAYRLHGSDRPAGFISFYNPTDLIFGYSVGAESDILNSRVLLRGLLGGTPEQAHDLYESASVMNAVTADACPTLLVHGEKDTIVWVRHSERLLKVLKDFGIDAEFLHLPFGPHGFDYFFNGPESQVAVATVDHFLARILPVTKM